MFKKFLFVIITLGIVLGCAAYGTFAWFTSQASSNDNIFQTGELAIGIPFEGANDGFISARNLFPGESVTKNLEVKNLGDVTFKYKVLTSKDEGDDNLYNKLQLKILRSDAEIYNGGIKDLNFVLGNITSANSDNLKFIVSLPEDADNTYQGKLANVKFAFNATQTTNSGWSE